MDGAAHAQDGSRSVQNRVWFPEVARGVGVLIVLIYHQAYHWYYMPAGAEQFTGLTRIQSFGPPPFYDSWNWVNEHIVNVGYSAMGLFFLVSGYVVMNALSVGNVRSFYVRRVFRIFPIYLIGMLIAIGTLYIVVGPHSPTFPGPSKIFFNAILLQPLRGGSIDPVNWTLFVEEMFYILAATLAAFGLLKKPLVVAACSLALLPISVAVRFAPANSYLGTHGPNIFIPLSFISFVLIGTVLFQWHRGMITTKLAVILSGLMLGSFMLEQAFGIAGGSWAEHETSYLFAFAIFVLLMRKDHRVPRHKTVRFFSDISFPLYATHSILGLAMVEWFTVAGIPLALSILLSISISIGFAWLLHKVVEDPARLFGRRLARPLEQRHRARELDRAARANAAAKPAVVTTGQ